MKIFLDTNIFLRFYTPEDQLMYEACKQTIQACNEGKFRPYTSNVVLLELTYVLTSLYKFPKSQILEAITDLCNMRNLTIIEKTNSKHALALYKKYAIKLGDCFIATQVPHGVVLCTYDRDFKHIPSLHPTTPEVLLQNNR